MSSGVIALKRMISVIAALILLFLAITPLPSGAYQTTTYRMSSDHLELSVNATGVYLTDVEGKDVHIEKLVPDTYGADLHMDLTVADAGVFGNTVVLLCNNVANNQLEVYTYRADTDVLDSFAVNNIRYYGGRGFCFTDDSIYLVSDRSTNIIERYGTSGALLNSYSFNSDITRIDADYRGGVCVVCADTLYVMSGGSFSPCSGAEVKAPVSWFDDSHFADASGRIIEVSGGSCRTLFKADAGYGKQCACMLDGIFYYPDGSTVYGYDASGQKRYSIELNSTVTDLFSYTGMICALSIDGTPVISRIRPDEFTDLNARADDAIPEPIYDASPANGAISSAVYRVDHDTYRISGIPAGTTLAQFKKNMSFDGYTVSFYRDGSQKTSGNCGTAMTAVFDSDRYRRIYELSVIGDITGEGNVNSRDLSLLTEYLIHTADFNGVYLLSADLSNDGKVDVKDLALMHRMI